MYKRNYKPIFQFLQSSPSEGAWYVDAGYGKLYYKSKEVAGTINTRINAAGSTIIIEIEDV